MPISLLRADNNLPPWRPGMMEVTFWFTAVGFTWNFLYICGFALLYLYTICFALEILDCPQTLSLVPQACLAINSLTLAGFFSIFFLFSFFILIVFFTIQLDEN